MLQASAQRRRKRVVNGGYIFRLYRRSAMDAFDDQPIAEIARVCLVDVCLYGRLLIPEEMELCQFFNSLSFGERPPPGACHQ